MECTALGILVLEVNAQQAELKICPLRLLSEQSANEQELNKRYPVYGFLSARGFRRLSFLGGCRGAFTENRGEPWRCALAPSTPLDAGEGVIAFVGENGRPRKPTPPPRGSPTGQPLSSSSRGAGTGAAGRSYRELQSETGRVFDRVRARGGGVAPGAEWDPRSASTGAPLV